MKTLFYFELKKIVNRRILWVCLSISFVLIVVTVGGTLLGSYYIDGERIGSNYEMFQIDAAYQRALDGRAIDEVLLSEMQEAYRKVPLDAEQYSLTEEYQKYARAYSVIYNYVRQTTGLSGIELLENVTNAEDLHVKRMERQEVRWNDNLLSEVEKDFWRNQESKIQSPIVFQYAEGYSVLTSSVYTVGLLTIFMVSVCLAGVFPEEHVKRTDKMILSSKHGRGDIYKAKFMAGLLVAFLMSFTFVLITFGTAFVIYGAEGYDAAFQLIYAGSSSPISVGEAVLIAYLMVLFAGGFTGAIVMMLSELLHSSVNTLAIVIGIILVSMMVTVPEEYRLMEQLWSYLPSNFVAGWSIFSPCTVVILGKIFLAWQVVPVLYIALGKGAALVTKNAFVKYQVSGR